MTISSTTDPFSLYAGVYDREFSMHPQVQRLRGRIYREALATWQAGAMVLDLGCGTGEDALYLRRHGIEVTAADPSAGMIKELRTKIAAENVPMRFIQLNAEQLGELPENSFEGIFSNFGALNCSGNLPSIFDECERILQDDGILMICLLNPHALWETAAFIARGHFRAAFRRWHKRSVKVPIGERSVPVWYYSTSHVLRIARAKFEVRKITGLNIFSPPPSSFRFHEKHPHLVRLLEAADQRIQSLPLVSRLGDHVLLSLQRKSTLAHPSAGVRT